ncbi:MAG: acylphosphatase [Planctomycetales bacterium]|nr:acylphosphatase [Planctomycetales bacterium]MCA9208648.1 acylphosphatase [Planctomycetales bacterium]
MERRTVVFSGHVQGVGFRFTTNRIAAGFQVTGYVRNLSNGTVELVAEGQIEELDAFLAEVNHRMEGFVRDTKVDSTNIESPRFKEFTISTQIG